MSAQHYDKIVLSKQDLAHLYRQFLVASQAKILQHLPVSDRLDPLRVDVENIVNDNLAAAFELAKLAFIVDGRDLAEENVLIRDILALQPLEEVVPFDTELNQKLRAVIQLVEQETTEVTRLRRELPQQTRDAYESLVAGTDQEVTAIIKELGEDESANVEVPSMEETIPNSDAIVGDLEESIRVLTGLKNSLPNQRAHLDSLDQTIRFLEDNYKRQEGRM